MPDYPLTALAGGFDDVQDTAPSSPSIGDTWFDTSVESGAGKIYADLGGGAQWHVLPVQNELQSGRTRELLLLLQNQPVPEVVDPLNLQSDLSALYTQTGSDYEITASDTSTASRPDDDTTVTSSNRVGVEIEPQDDITQLSATVSSNTSGLSTVYLLQSDGSTVIATKSASSSGESVSFSQSLTQGTKYYVAVDNGGSSYDYGYYTGSVSYPYTSNKVDITYGFTSGSGNYFPRGIKSVSVDYTPLNAHVTDRFAAPTTAPADFKQWNAIRAEDVTTGGSTSANPVEFEILDSSDTVLTSARIPKSELADEKFHLRDREYTTTAGSNGQSDYTIPQTGAGGHFGLPILTAVNVQVNGNYLDSSNFEFDGTDTVTIDTNNVTISSGDTITVAYDFDVFDSTLQPRAYLTRASTSETSPSISHFRYEYTV